MVSLLVNCDMLVDFSLAFLNQIAREFGLFKEDTKHLMAFVILI